MKTSQYIFPFLCLFILISCGEEVVQQEEIIRPVRYELVGTSASAKIRTFSGTAKAGDEIELSFRSTGIITELKARVGKKVKKGELIARLDNVQANLAYEQSISALNTAKSAMNTSKSNLERIRSLYEKGSSSLSDYESAKNGYQSALDQYESAKRNKSIQQTQINYGYIYAPKDGVIASRNLDLNETAAAGQVIAILNAGDQTNIEVGLPESLINRVSLGMEADLKVAAIDDKTFTGHVIEVAPIADLNSASYKVKVGVDKTNSVIKPGMTASVTFNFQEDSKQSNQLIIPVKAVGEDGDGNYVFLIESSDGKTGIAKKQSIKIGRLTGDGFEVTEGLSKGHKVATAGLQSLLNGQKVKLD